MPDEFDQSQVDAPTTDQSASGVGQLDLDKFKNDILSAVTSSFDERFQGFQKILSKRDKELEAIRNEVQQANRSTLTEEEVAALEVQEKDQQIAALQRALELKELEREFPDVAPHYSKILEADSGRAQMEILRELLSPKKEERPNEQPDSALEPQVSSVDPNAPADTGTDGLNYDQMFEKDPGLLDRILKGATRLRGPE